MSSLDPPRAPGASSSTSSRRRPDSTSSQDFDDLSLSDTEPDAPTRTTRSNVDPWRDVSDGAGGVSKSALDRKPSQDSITASFSDFLDEPISDPPPLAVVGAADAHTSAQAPDHSDSLATLNGSCAAHDELPALVSMSRVSSAARPVGQVPLVLGVAVVDFNHLVRDALRQTRTCALL